MILNETQVKCFLAVAKSHNFSVAAKELFLTQPAISANVRRLERELDLQLFERKYHDVELTAAGERFLVTAQAMAAAYQKFVHEVNQQQLASGPTRLRVGFVITKGLDPVKQQLQQFARAHPQVRVMTSEVYTDRIIPALLDQQIDLGIGIITPHPAIQWRQLLTDEFVVVARSDRFAQAPAGVSLKKLKETPLFLKQQDLNEPIASMLRRLIGTRTFDVVDSDQALYPNLTMADAFTIMPANEAREINAETGNSTNLRAFSITDKPLAVRQFKLGWAMRRGEENDGVTAFLRFVK